MLKKSVPKIVRKERSGNYGLLVIDTAEALQLLNVKEDRVDSNLPAIESVWVR